MGIIKMKNGTIAAVVLGLFLAWVIIANVDLEEIKATIEESDLYKQNEEGLANANSDEFGLFVGTYGKSYETLEEHQKRYSIFKENLKLINEHNKNAEVHGFTLGMNKFGDLSNEEYVSKYLQATETTKPKTSLKTEVKLTSDAFLKESKTEKAIKNLQIPASVDWVEAGAVGPARDMGECKGAHWAFSAITAVEGSNFIHRQRNETLSVQQVIDCVKGGDFHSEGCKGGHIREVFDYAKESDLCAEEDYPWEGEQGTCTAWWHCSTDNYVKSYKNITAGSRFELYSAIAQGPVAITVDAASDEFRFYSGGIYGSKCQEDPNHAMTAVGYGTETWMFFWNNHFVNFRNSWGEDWGESGFIRISSNFEEGKGMCGIYQEGYLPIISH